MVGTRADWKKYRRSGAAFRMVVDVTQRLELAGTTFLGTRCTAQPSLGSAVLAWEIPCSLCGRKSECAKQVSAPLLHNLQPPDGLSPTIVHNFYSWQNSIATIHPPILKLLQTMCYRVGCITLFFCIYR